MVITIERASHPADAPALASMFRDRKTLFVDLFGWDVPVVDGQYEMDQFDDGRAVYLIFVDGHGDHEASLRLLPTSRPHMLGTIFSDLCPLGVPTGPTVWESTRLCLPQRHGAARRRMLRDHLISAMVDFALARGITRFTGVLPDAFRKEVLSMGWRGEPLGPTMIMVGGKVGAFAVDIDHDPRALAMERGLSGAERTVEMSVPSILRYGARLGREGYCILPRAVEPDVIAQLEVHLGDAFAHTPMGVGPFYGERTRRFGALLRRSSVARTLAMHPVVLAIVEQQLLPWCDRIALNLTQAIEIHPGAPAQLPHRDQDMWPGPKGAIEYLVNVMWPLTPFGADNGGTRLWPESHVDQDVVTLPEAEAIVPAVLPGDALIFLGSTLHGGGANRAALPRRGVVISYCLGWLKPFELQWLVYPPSVARTFDAALAALVGYAQHRPNLGNVEGRCPSILLGDSLPRYIGAVDALRSDQQQAAAAFRADPGRQN